jgi:hypothetical protein
MRITMVLAFSLSLLALSDASAQQQRGSQPSHPLTTAQPTSSSDFEWWCMHTRRHCPFPIRRSAAHFDWWCKHQKGSGRIPFLRRDTAGCFKNG